MPSTPTEPIDPAIHEGDLLLAAGCAGQDPLALASFEERYLRQLRSFVTEIDSSPARALSCAPRSCPGPAISGVSLE